MSMNTAHAYKQTQVYEEQQSIRVLDGRRAKAREEAKRKGIVRLSLGAAAVMICLLGMTFMSAKICNLGVEINSLKSQIEDTQVMTARAELQLGELSSLERIESYAVANLGMVYPSADYVYFLSAASTQTVAETETLVAAIEEESTWQKLLNNIAGFFRGTASAADNI